MIDELQNTGILWGSTDLWLALLKHSCPKQWPTIFRNILGCRRGLYDGIGCMINMCCIQMRPLCGSIMSRPHRSPLCAHEGSGVCVCVWYSHRSLCLGPSPHGRCAWRETDRDENIHTRVPTSKPIHKRVWVCIATITCKHRHSCKTTHLCAHTQTHREGQLWMQTKTTEPLKRFSRHKEHPQTWVTSSIRYTTSEHTFRKTPAALHLSTQTRLKCNLDGSVVHSLEVAGGAYVCLGELLPLALDFLLLLAEAAVQHVVDVVWLGKLLLRVVEAHIVNLWVLDVHCGHRESRAYRRRERWRKKMKSF